jgi:hypothetical protein
MLGQRLIKKFKEAQQQLETYVIRGNAQDLVQYKFAIGQIKGLQEAINICRDVFKGENNDEL